MDNATPCSRQLTLSVAISKLYFKFSPEHHGSIKVMQGIFCISNIVIFKNKVKNKIINQNKNYTFIFSLKFSNSRHTECSEFNINIITTFAVLCQTFGICFSSTALCRISFLIWCIADLYSFVAEFNLCSLFSRCTRTISLNHYYTLQRKPTETLVLYSLH